MPCAPFADSDAPLMFRSEVNTNPKRMAPKPARVLYDYVARDTYDISLTEGTVITVLETVRLLGDAAPILTSVQRDDGWCYGRVGRDKEGLFPAAYIKQLK